MTRNTRQLNVPMPLTSLNEMSRVLGCSEHQDVNGGKILLFHVFKNNKNNRLGGLSEKGSLGIETAL